MPKKCYMRIERDHKTTGVKPGPEMEVDSIRFPCHPAQKEKGPLTGRSIRGRRDEKLKSSQVRALLLGFTTHLIDRFEKEGVTLIA
jgi:hypothetical protein